MDGGAWQATVHGVSKSRTQLSDFSSAAQRHHWWLLCKVITPRPNPLCVQPAGRMSVNIHFTGWTHLSLGNANDLNPGCLLGAVTGGECGSESPSYLLCPESRGGGACYLPNLVSSNPWITVLVKINIPWGCPCRVCSSARLQNLPPGTNLKRYSWWT